MLVLFPVFETNVFILAILVRTYLVAFKYFIRLCILHSTLWKNNPGKAGKCSFLFIIYNPILSFITLHVIIVHP